VVPSLYGRCVLCSPHDVLATLLNNLKVQERQNRVCTTVAIAIVAETCSPFTVLPGLMNEYRVPELNVQNGVLKSLSFMFEYIGEMGKDYVYAVAPLLEDALMDRQVASFAKFLAMPFCVNLKTRRVTDFKFEYRRNPTIFPHPTPSDVQRILFCVKKW